MSHNQNFKNLILDYLREALAFFDADEADGIDEHTCIASVRQEQLQERLSERFRELGVPLLVECGPMADARLWCSSSNEESDAWCFPSTATSAPQRLRLSENQDT